MKTSVQKKPAGKVKTTVQKKLAATTKKPAGSAAAPSSAAAPPADGYAEWHRAAVEVCRKLTAGEIRIEDLGNTLETARYVLLRDVAPAWLAKEEHKTLAKDWVEGVDPNVALLAHVCAWEIDGGDLAKAGAREGEAPYKVLFSDTTDKEFFSLGVEDGNIIGDAANQFREHLLSKYTTEQITEAMKAPRLKFLEDELVMCSDLPEGSLR